MLAYMPLRIGSIVPAAGTVTLVLFLLMSYLISQPITLPSPEAPRMLMRITPAETPPDRPIVRDAFEQPDILVPPAIRMPTADIDPSGTPISVPDLTTFPSESISNTPAPSGTALLGNRAVQLLRHPIPVYPSRAQTLGLEGRCDLYMDVDTHGQPFNVRTTCTDGTFESAAIASAKQVRFIPRIQNGQAAIQKDVVIPIEFKLEN